MGTHEIGRETVRRVQDPRPALVEDEFIPLLFTELPGDADDRAQDHTHQPPLGFVDVDPEILHRSRRFNLQAPQGLLFLLSGGGIEEMPSVRKLLTFRLDLLPAFSDILFHRRSLPRQPLPSRTTGRRTEEYASDVDNRHGR